MVGCCGIATALALSQSPLATSLHGTALTLNEHQLDDAGEASELWPLTVAEGWALIAAQTGCIDGCNCCTKSRIDISQSHSVIWPYITSVNIC